jgi:predicted Zn finger-like uncharacterized protein
MMDMFTQCPQCETVFRLTADALGAAGGQVRCGRCSAVFDALKRLAEEPRMFVIGESTLELEARAEQILAAADELPADGDVDIMDMTLHDDDGIARLEVQDIELPLDQELMALPTVERAPDSALEFTLPPADLDRIFVDGQGMGAQAPAIVAEVAASLRESPQAFNPAASAPEAFGPATTAATGLERALWSVAALLLTLLLAAQVTHRYRETLAGLPTVGPWLRVIYAQAGLPIPVPASLSGYQLRQWGASGDASASGPLRVRASILNTTGQTQPFPLLRVTLTDRFGAHLGSRDFEPTDYVGRPVRRLLAPGERADATVDIQDPGRSAESFELDVCLRDADGRVRCAGDNAPHR